MINSKFEALNPKQYQITKVQMTKTNVYLMYALYFWFLIFNIRSLPAQSNIQALFPVKQNGKYGYIDNTGKIMIKSDFINA